MNKLCNICPKNCNISRKTNIGFCGATDKIVISKVMMHHFEEPIISGDENSKRGSGAIFFSGCNLRCVYCQNYDISHKIEGKETSPSELAEIFKRLENAGAYNINLVTPTHFTLQILEALKIYKPKIPVVWNSSGYEKPETIKLLDGYVDIFLVDFKYFGKKAAKKYSFAENYGEFCRKSILQMRKIVPNDIIRDGIMQKGLIVRHLALPSLFKDSLKVIDFVYNKLGKDTIFSLMSQYVPMAKANLFPEINRKVTPLEYKVLVARLESLQMNNCFVQEISSASTCYTPNFSSHDDDI